jgi:putative DNA primase/helicase
VTGSIAFAALARLVLVAAKERAEGGDDVEPRRLLVRAKSNIGPDSGGFGYALERVEVAPEVEGQRVRWLEALEGTARELLADAEADADNESQEADDVDGFLRGLLVSGPLTAKTIKADADGAGYAWRTVQRASKRLGVVPRKEGMRGGWVWSLPDSQATPKAPLRPEGAEDANLQSVTPSAPSPASVAPSDDGEVF